MHQNGLKALLAGLCVMIFAGAGVAQGARSWNAPWTGEEIEALAFALSEAWTHGLDPADYPDPAELLAMAPGPERNRTARAAWFAYAGHLAFGKVDPRSLDPNWSAPARDIDLLTQYAQARERGEILETLETFAPSNPDYTALRAELIRRRALPSAPVRVPHGPALSEGDSGPRVDALRARLHQIGLLASPGRAGAAFDAQLSAALIRFQTRHNLAADGVAGTGTLAELNAGEERRIDQLRANLERWRWLPADLGERHIRVNIADYRLEAWSGGQAERVHDTMIGTQYARTPVFSGSMSIIEINPWWYTPLRLGAPWLRQFRTNPAYAYGEGYHLVDLDTGQRVNAHNADWENRRYRVIQQPGPNNAMGRVKFLFPNRHNVYIHDTPHRGLFANIQRDDSSGCVRVSNPEALAVWALAGEGWSPQRVHDAFEGDQTVRIRLRNEIPVHILYFTAAVGRFGDVRFIHDVYRRDAALVAALDGPARPVLMTGARDAAPEPEALPGAL